MGAAIAYLHFLSMMAIGAILFGELLLTQSLRDPNQVRKLAWIDLGYLVAAALVLLTGVARLVWYGKGAAFYLHNPVFYIKLALFVAIGLISIPPTMRMLRWRSEAKRGTVPHPDEIAHVRRYILTELALFVFIPLTAVWAARGIGMHG